jgi:alpha-tubulin suppressor-like RCC1 family protein
MGQCGHGGTATEAAPRRVEALRQTRVVGLAAGHFHSLALTEDDTVYTWGSSSHGELGHPSAAHQLLPRALGAARGHRLLFAACGGTHSVLLLGGHGGDQRGGDGGSSDETS